MAAHILCVLATIAALSSAEGQSIPQLGNATFPRPFKRILSYGTNMTGSDVTILQNIGARCLGVAPVSTGVFDASTQQTVEGLEKLWNLPVDGVFDAQVATYLMDRCTRDGYKDDGASAASKGYQYKVVIPIYANRSIETIATLYSANNTVLLNFVARTKGNNENGNPAWPDFNNTGPGLNEFTSNGNTPTGLVELDLNSPEPADVFYLYGQWDVNRATVGLEGNAKFLISNIRTGILIHTGQWPNWTTTQTMPNSDGCIHVHPSDAVKIEELLKQEGIISRPNPLSSKNYPYKAQGLMSVYIVDETPSASNIANAASGLVACLLMALVAALAVVAAIDF